MKIIIHAGMQKTGSTALQDYLANHRAELRDMGVIYPDFGHRSHWLLAAALAPDPESVHHAQRRLEADDIENTTDAVRKSFESIISSTAGDDTIIISHESLGVRSRAKALQEIVSRFCADVDIIAYVRNPVEHFPSGIQNALRSNGGIILNPSNWKSRHPSRSRALHNVFKDRVTIRAHSKFSLIDYDIIKDFSEFVFFKTGKVLPINNIPSSNNSSLSAAACAILEMSVEAVGKSLNLEEIAILRTKVSFTDSLKKRDKLRTPDNWKDNIMDTNRHGWNYLIDTMDYDRALKDLLRFPKLSNPLKTVTDAEVKKWIASYFSVDFAREVADASRKTAMKNKRPAYRVADWLENIASQGVERYAEHVV